MARFIASSLSNLVNTSLKKFIKLNPNRDMIEKRCETGGIKYNDCERCLEYTNVKDDLIVFKCLCCNKNYQKKCDKNLKK